MNFSNFSVAHYGGLISVFWATLNKKSANNYLRFILCSIGVAICAYIYMCWNRIPVREHYIQVEHCMSNDTTRHPIAYICLNMNYGSIVDKQLPRAHNSFNRFIITSSYKKLGFRTPFVCAVNNLNDVLGNDLYKEVKDSCEKQGLDEDFVDIYYISGMQSVDEGDINKSHMVQADTNGTILFGTNDDRIFNSGLCKNYGYTIQKDEFLKKGDYQGKAFSSYAGIILSRIGEVTIHIPDIINNGFPNVLKLEDISQSYYRIKIHSSTIDSLALHVDFVGATNFSKFGYEPNKMDMCSFDYNDFQRCPALSEITFHASFQETQNLQVVRCFFLTAIITLLITIALKSFGNIIYGKFLANKNKEFNS